MPKDVYLHWTKSCGIKKLDYLRFLEFVWLDSSTPRTRGGSPIQARCITFVSCDIEFDDLLLCIPARPSNFTFLVIEPHEGPTLSPAQFEVLAKALGQQLRLFAFSVDEGDCPPEDEPEYHPFLDAYGFWTEEQHAGAIILSPSSPPSPASVISSSNTPATRLSRSSRLSPTPPPPYQHQSRPQRLGLGEHRAL